MLRWDPATNVYHYIRRFRLEKSNNGEGDFNLIERVIHMPDWIVACTVRALRVFRLEESTVTLHGQPVQKALKDTRCIKNAISKQLIKLQQVEGMILLICLDCVNILKVTEDDAQIVHTVEYDRCSRVGILPGFDYENFPFILRQHQYHSVNHKMRRERCVAPEMCIKKEWRSHHLRITQDSYACGIGNLSPQLFDFETKTLVAIDEDNDNALC